jgi:iron complex transport system ATP-binding protein
LAIVQITDLVADYGKKALIRNLSFTITDPAFVAVVGHNGCGKTTLFKAFTQQIPYQGSIKIDNQPLTSTINPAEKGLLSLLAQKNTVNFTISVKELIVMGRFRLKRFFEPYDNTDYNAVAEVLQLLQMTHLTEANFLELSGGEQQMVWLAQLMVQNTPVYLLDEPTQHLDLYNKKRVFNLMMNWVQHARKTVLCITHDLYNLYQTEGYMLNLSTEHPFLEPISPASIQKHIHILENK